MPDDQNTADIPRSCGEAWMAFFADEMLVEGSPTVNTIDDMQRAFDAGWRAALAAVGACHEPT